MAMELVALVISGLISLAGWPLGYPFGWPPDTDAVVMAMGLIATVPATELYRASGPPHRLAVVAALLVLATVSVLVTAAVNRAFPALADPGVGFLVGLMAALPVGVAVLAWLLGRTNAA
ncbi:hypothetical protein [Streptomyces sp. NPDC050145]|uniref:hypothetical protein n=1 Tax=Streptomyces sp. NPDC050145 TaxID=3365602 RepID=UPI0037B69ABC